MKTKDIVRDIVRDIFNGKYLKNEKLLSEKQISIKYNVSRIIATKSYQILKQIGAAYSIPKKGFFVAENFTGIIRNIADEYDIDNFKDYGESSSLIDIDGGKYLYFKRDYFKDGELIIKSENYLNAEYLSNNFVDPLNSLIWEDHLISAVKKIKFEKVSTFNSDLNLIQETTYYSPSQIAYIQKAIIKPEIFKLTKLEWSI